VENLSIFECLYPLYQINKPIRLIELFAGYGSQALALKYLGVEFEHYAITEWNYKSIEAYRALHYPGCENEYIHLMENQSKEEIAKKLFELGISADWDKPMTLAQISRMSENKLKQIWSDILVTKNTVDISKTPGQFYKIDEEHTYIMTYSFPCQDLSLAGKQGGMKEGTRSGLLWQVHRLLTEMEIKPHVLLMENVTQVHNQENMPMFRKWMYELEQMGYQSYWQDLIATDYGIPQIRNRCFMVSVRGDYCYNFPKPFPLQIKLQDLLEKDVDEKYILSEKMLKYLTSGGGRIYRRLEKFMATMEKIDNGISPIITSQNNRAYSPFIKIRNGTKQGYLEAEENDIIDITSSCTKNHRGVVQKGKSQTIVCADGGGRGVVIRNPKVVAGIGDKKSNKGTQYYIQNRVYEGDVSTTTTTEESHQPYWLMDDLKIRKLTPRECFRLQGVRDDDIDKLMHMSDTTLYHLAGDSIVVNVLMAIFKEMIGDNNGDQSEN